MMIYNEHDKKVGKKYNHINKRVEGNRKAKNGR
jgi:hypothetical protein